MNGSFKASTSQKGATWYLHVEEPFRFASGGRIPRVNIAYETWGKLDPERSNAGSPSSGLAGQSTRTVIS
jgi:homoserine O-acetyltransferase